MRIDGSIPEQAFPKAGRAERITAGDVVQGKIVSTDGGQIQLRLSDGSTLHAKVAEGVNLENGTTVRLQIGEKKEGVPTARILERSAPQSAVSAGAMTPEGEIGEALRNLGEKVLPALMERAVTLQERTGVTAGQAAFLTANNLDGDPAAGAMLARMLNGRFGFSANWTALSSGMADAASALSPENRTALVQSLLLSEQVGKLVDAFLSGTQANAGAAVGADNGSGAAAGAGTTGEAASGTGTTSNAGTGESTPADGSSPGRTLLANPIKDLLMQWAERPPIAGDAIRQLQEALAGVPGGKAFLSSLTGKPDGSAAVSMESISSTGTPGSTTVASGMVQAGTVGSGQTAASVSTVPSSAALSATGNMNVGTTSGQPADATSALPAGAAADSIPFSSVNPISEPGIRMEELLGRLAKAVETSGLSKNPTPEETRALVSASFDRIVMKAGMEGDENLRTLDVAKMAHAVKEQLEWSSRALARMDSDTAAALAPAIQDAAGAMRLFSQITTYNTFVQIPIQMNSQNTQGELYVMKRKGGRNRIDATDFTLFLSLDTENLGHLESLAHAKNRQVSLQFRVEDEETQNLLRETRQTLYEGLDKKGFRLVDMKVRTASEEPLSPLNAVKEAEERLGRNAGLDIRL